MTMTQSKTLKDVLYIRCFAVVSLVAWHSYCIYICQGFADSPMHDAYARLFSLDRIVLVTMYDSSLIETWLKEQ